MTRRIFKTIFFHALFLISLRAQINTDISVEGNKTFGDNKYIEWIGSLPDTSENNSLIDSVKSGIARGLTDEGYYHFEFDSVKIFMKDSLHREIEISLSENTPTIFGRIEFTGVSGEDSIFARESFDSIEGEMFSSWRVEEIIGRILSKSENDGYPFAEVDVQSAVWKDTSEIHTVNLKIKISEGGQSRVDLIEIEGNTKTNDDVILRELRLARGSLYSQKIIDEIPERLNKLKFFEPVSSPEYYENSDDKGILLIKVKEKQTNNFDGILGYVPPSGDIQSGYFTGYINISLRNLFGTGRAFAIRWQTEDRYTQEFELKYLEPWVFSYPFNLNFNLFQRKQDTTYIKRSFYTELDFLATENITASLLAGSGSTIASENKGAKTVFNSDFFDLGFKLKIDTRDDPYAPRKGLLFLNSYKLTKKSIAGPPELITGDIKLENNLQNFTLDFGIYYEILKRQIIAASVHGRELRGDMIDKGDLFLFGGTNSLRGYREKQFTANRLLWSNLEYRYLLSRRSFAFLFFDSGYYLRNKDELTLSERVEQTLYGYGFGLSLETGLGVLAVSYAIAKGTPMSEGLIHFGIINEF